MHDAWADFVVVKLADGMAALEDHLRQHRAAHPRRIPGPRPMKITALLASSHNYHGA